MNETIVLVWLHPHSAAHHRALAQLQTRIIAFPADYTAARQAIAPCRSENPTVPPKLCDLAACGHESEPVTLQRHHFVPVAHDAPPLSTRPNLVHVASGLLI